VDRRSDIAPPAAPGSTSRSPATTSDGVFLDPAVFSTVLQQNWENARSIKNQRIWFLNTFAVISAGTQSFLLSARAEPLLQLALDLSMCVFAVMGLLISLRLKAELEECLEKIHALVVRAHLEEFMALERSEGDLSRFPQFRWMFPVFYTVAIAIFAAQVVHGLIAQVPAP